MVARRMAARASNPARSRHRSSGGHRDNACRFATIPPTRLVVCSRGGFADRSVRLRLVVVSLWLGWGWLPEFEREKKSLSTLGGGGVAHRKSPRGWIFQHIIC